MNDKTVSTTLRIVEAVVRRSSVNYAQRQVGVMEKKVFLKILQNSQENNCARASVLIKFQKIRLWHSCFPVHLAKFSRTTFIYRSSCLEVFYKLRTEVVIEVNFVWSFKDPLFLFRTLIMFR